jgi:hypothetical protein
VRSLRLCALAAIAIGFGCNDSSGPSGGVVERRVYPSQTNATITQWNAQHYVWLDPAAQPATRQLLVLFPGTSGAPQEFRMFGTIAATQGYQVIGLMYPNDVAAIGACTVEIDSTCMAALRTEIVEGTNTSPYVNVDYANSIDGRLVSLLRYLAEHYPAEAWDTFLSNDQPRWDMIAVGGLSQGGGHAAFIAKLRAVPRVLMFGAPTDGFNGEPAAWMTIGATPVERYYGLVHERDPFPSIVPNWRALGMEELGALAVVEHTAPSFDGSHMLTTDLVPATGSYSAAHASVFLDGATPLGGSGAPILEPVWRYMLGTP